MAEICTDNRFELISKYKQKLIEATNIETAKDEMATIDNILFRFWQMGWLDRLEEPWIPCTPDTMPLSDEEVIVSIHDDRGDTSYDYTTSGWYFDGVWIIDNERGYNVVAWQPLPKPWKGEQNE